MKRIIKVTATYDLDDEPYLSLSITPKETVKQIVEDEMVEYFAWDEGYLGIEVEVIDE
jgi:hypothetical protein